MDLGGLWQRHADSPEQVLTELGELLDQATEAKQWFGLAALGAHVSGAHLGDWQRGVALLHRVQALDAFDSDTAQGRGTHRLLATLHTCAGEMQPAGEALARSHNPGDPADCATVRMLASVAEALVERGEAERAQQAFDKALDLASYGPEKGDPAARALAMAGNNVACSLEVRSDRSDVETALMKQAAHVGRTYWELAGDWKNVKIAEYRLAMTHLAAGEPRVALEHAKRAVAQVSAHDGTDEDRFFPRLAMAQAHLDLGQQDAARDVLEQASTAVVEWGRAELDALLQRLSR
ncbi:MAG: hypothetical protein KC912_12985 [Proteobacteria bacterium]|nr:hypothetical protein [Pseudomonadota bacterium]